jgi:hypothetical protein
VANHQFRSQFDGNPQIGSFKKLWFQPNPLEHKPKMKRWFWEKEEDKLNWENYGLKIELTEEAKSTAKPESRETDRSNGAAMPRATQTEANSLFNQVAGTKSHRSSTIGPDEVRVGL